MAVAQEVLEVIQLLNTLTNLVQGMAPQQNQLAKEPSPFSIYTDVEITRQALTAGIYSLPAIVQRLAEIQSSLVQLGIPQQAFEPVVLPRVAPSGYGGSSANDVWSFPLVSDVPFTTGDWASLAFSREFEENRAGVGSWSGYFPGYRVGLALGGATADIPNGPTSYPLDPATIVATDASVLAWVSRVYPATTWRTNPAGAVFEADTGVAGVFWYVGITDDMFLELQRSGPGGSLTKGKVAPVWPGLANVALGAPVAITSGMSGLTIPGPLDGVITAIATVPVPIGYYSFDGDKSFVHLGGIAFQSDDGQDEAAQPMTFQAQIIVPRSMVRASAAKVRVQSGTTGTITPWTIT